MSAAFVTLSEGMPRPECEIISFAAYRSSIAGLKICTRWRAISARRKRRINSSLLPENIGPTTTSIQPMLPLTMSTVFSCRKRRNPALLQLSRSRGRMIHLRVIKRSKSDDHRNAKSLCTMDQAARQHAPSTLRVANPHRASKAIDGDGKFHATVQNFPRQSIWNLDATGTPVMPMKPVRNVGPALQQHAASASLLDDVQAAFEPDKIVKRLLARRLMARSAIRRRLVARDLLPGSETRHLLSALPRTLHQFQPIRRRMPHAAGNLDTNHFKFRTGSKHRAEIPQRFLHRQKFRLASAAHRNLDFLHGKIPSTTRGRADCSGCKF